MRHLPDVSVTARVLLVSSLALACADDPASPDFKSGKVEVTVIAAGAPTATQYDVLVDGQLRGTVLGGTATSPLDLSAGDHSVSLGMPPGCIVDGGENPRGVVVVSSETRTVDFRVECPGVLQVTTVTIGTNLPAGFELSLNGEIRRIGANATLEIGAVAPGTFTVALRGVAPNCVAREANPRLFPVARGATVPVLFGVTCAENTGNLRVQTVTSGDRSPGLTVAVDGRPPINVPANGITMFTGLQGGERTFAVFSDCQGLVVEGVRQDWEGERFVAIRDGQTTDVTVTVTCYGWDAERGESPSIDDR